MANPSSAAAVKRPGAPASVAKTAPTPPSPPAAAEPVHEPLFRRIDWVTFIVTVLITLTGYLLTLCPDLTLEDCGELAVGSMYAGVPHPPGYPVWTLYTFLFTKLIPFSNIAFRVSVSSAVAASCSAGILAMLVSRGSSMLLEGLEFFAGIEKKLESQICLAAGIAGGLLIGFNGYIWSQAVIVEVYTLAVLTLMLLLACLLRWIHDPRDRRYLYLAFFFFGLCLCNHQTLIVAAMGLEVAALAADRRTGRDFFLWNSIIYTLVVGARAVDKTGILADNPDVFAIFIIIGLASLLTVFWFNGEMNRRTRLQAILILGVIAILMFINYRVAVHNEGEAAMAAARAQATGTPSTTVLDSYRAAVGWSKASLGILALFSSLVLLAQWPISYATESRDRLFSRWWPTVAAGLCFLAGAAFYFYMPLTSATNPPMNWGYPRTWEGFIHAFTRGQYEKTNPSLNPLTLAAQIQMYAQGAKEEFNWSNLLVGLTPFLFLSQMKRRERGWLVGLTAIYLTLALLLLILLNPGLDRQGRSLVKVFFTSSHVVIALAIGYGFALIAGMSAVRYRDVRYWLLLGATLAVALNLYDVIQTWGDTQEPNKRIGPVVSLVLSSLFLATVLWKQERFPLRFALALFCLVPVDSMFSHWADNEQRGHLFGFWFGHDMFTPPFKDKAGKPLYPEMARDAVLYGGTDPGRFCPTYMIFCESFIPPSCRRDPDFDRRDVALITQNALADNTYLDYIRAHYNRSAEIDPPFFYGMLNDKASAERGRTNTLARLAAPLDTLITENGAAVEKRRRAGSSFFHAADFTDFAGLQAKLNGGADPLSAYLKSRLGGVPSSADALADALNKIIDDGRSLYDDPARFTGVNLEPRLLSFAKQNPSSPNRIRLNRELLEAAYPKQIAKSIGGLYPDREVLIATADDAGRCYNEYTMDAMRRYQLNQLDPGENVNQLPDGRVSVSGQVSVMAINGLITKVIFDKNPDHEFYIEESFPLKWMYQHLTPYGIIMKIERNPVADLSEDQLQRDHEFWSQFSGRLIGNWITTNTPVKEICEFAIRTYKQYDIYGGSNFKGDPKFVRDDVAQKSFSKLRNAIGKSIYVWRAQNTANPVMQRRYLEEAEFALKQAFAFCPFSPETVFNLAQLLMVTGHIDDAILVAETCQQLDPDSGAVVGLVQELKRVKNGGNAQRADQRPAAAVTPAAAAIQSAAAYIQAGKTNEAVAALDQALFKETVTYEGLMQFAEFYRLLGRTDRIADVVEKLVTVEPDSAEAWLNLAVIQATRGQVPEAKSNIARAYALNDRQHATNAKVPSLREMIKTDPRFAAVRASLQ
jgi:tetratricopeptide (TPR) repeat protein